MATALSNEFDALRPVVLYFGAVLRKLNDSEFFEFCQANRHMRIERTAEGDLVVMPPTGGETAHRNFLLYGPFNEWSEKDGSGLAFDSSTGFLLPNGALRSPDLAWVRRDRWETLSDAQKEGFVPLCPDFVIELRSRSDSLSRLRAKMHEYMENGAGLGWLIDPTERKVYAYSAQSGETPVESPKSLSGEPILRGFVLNLNRIWSS